MHHLQLLVHDEIRDIFAQIHPIAAPVFSASNNFAKTCRNCPANPQGDISSRSINSFNVSVAVKLLEEPRKGITI